MKAIVMRQAGGPEVLEYCEVAAPTPGPGEVLIKVAAAGINFSDVGSRRRASPAELPVVPGSEAAGTVIGVGAGVADFRIGATVACQPVPGCYAEQVVAPAESVVELPAGLDPRLAAAAMLQGRTAYAMAFHAYPIRPGDHVLIQAAAGGVGLLLTQLAKRAGAYVFATVGSDAKVTAAREAGADHVINYVSEDFATVIMAATNREGVNAIYDAVGQATFEKGLECLAQRGTLVSYGSSSGPIPPFDLSLLARSGGYVTRTNARKFASTLEEWRRHTNQVFAWVHTGELRVTYRVYPLSQAAEAHRALEGRQTVGKVLLIPDADS